MNKEQMIKLTKYRFNYSKGDLRGEILEHKLDKEEYQLIDDIVNGRNLDNCSRGVYNLAGRSIELISPTRCVLDVKIQKERDRFAGYGGLQIIGACGNDVEKVRNDLYVKKDRYDIFPVSDEDCSTKYENIFQLISIDRSGKIISKTREYAPLRGMDKGEATSRASFTNYFEKIMDYYMDKGLSLGFVVPRLACEGYFPDLFDNNGDNLMFQVYRVPFTKRLDSDLIESIIYEDLDFKEDVKEVGFRTGALLRNMHNLDIAYLDSHIGNMGLLRSGNKRTLYATDLGSCKNVKDEPYKDKYFGFDLYMNVYSFDKFIELLVDERFLKHHKMSSDFFENIGVVYTNSLIDAYFSVERSIEDHSFSDDSFYRDMRSRLVVGLLHDYKKFCNNFSEFLDVFRYDGSVPNDFRAKN